MTHDAPAVHPTAPPAPPPAGREHRSGDVRAAVSIAVALVVIGALLGVVWAVWSPPGPRALVIAPGALQADETEAFIAGDGRFLALSAIVGIVAGLLAWRRAANRGPLVLLALAVGGLAGAAAMALVGRLAGGGTDDGKANTLIAQLPLSVHVHGLYFVQAGLAVLVYGMLVAFTARDDLGRPDPGRDAVLAARRPPPAAPYPPSASGPSGEPPPARPSPYGQSPYGDPYARPYGVPSVGAGDQPQDGGRDGDAAGPLQQRDLPPQ